MARIALAFALIALSLPILAAPVETQPPGSQPADGKHTPGKPIHPKPHADKEAAGKPKTARPATGKPAAPKAAETKPPPQTPPLQNAPVAPADESKPDDAKAADAKAGPHFASLRPDKVYMRSGPRGDYPIQWIYVRRNLPVEVLAAFDIWRKIRDSEGTEGWVHQTMLTGRRNVLVTGAVRDLRSDPAPDAAIVARLEPGVLASLSKCDPIWCEVNAAGNKGWLKREEFWGLEPGEILQ